VSTPTTERFPATAVPGQDIGTSDWLLITQDSISQFGEVTLDPDPMHVDPDWAESGPFGHTIAFGFQTMSMLSHLLFQALGVDSSRHDIAQGYYLNYGCDRLRLITPVPVGSRIRGRFKIADVRQDAQDRKIVKLLAEVDIEGSDRIALFAEWLVMWVPPAAAR
jgi:acyl dehydratase